MPIALPHFSSITAHPHREALYQHLVAPLAQHLHLEPKCDIIETSDKIIYKILLAGLHRSEVHVALHEDELVVSGTYHTAEEMLEALVLVAEGPTGEFRRGFRVPRGTKGEEVEAEMKEGVLTVRVPKGVAREEGVRIEVA